MFGLVTRRRYEAELKAARAEADRQRGLREEAEKAQETAEFNRQQILVQNTALDTANRRLKTAGFDEAKAKESAERIARLQEAVSEARTEARTEKRRADHLQKRLDDAVGLGARVEDSRPWQPAYQKPKEDAS